VIALVVVYYLVVADYVNQGNQKATLEGQIADATAALATIPQPPTDLEERLATAQNELDVEKDIFNIDTDYTQTLNRILNIAKNNGVKAIPLTTQAWVTEVILSQNYSVFRIDIAVTGTYPQFVNFLNQLENSEPKNLLVEYLAIDIASGASLLDSATRNTLPIDANIRIAVYTSQITEG
jgi:hypothetical protein